MELNQTEKKVIFRKERFWHENEAYGSFPIVSTY